VLQQKTGVLKCAIEKSFTPNSKKKLSYLKDMATYWSDYVASIVSNKNDKLNKTITMNNINNTSEMMSDGMKAAGTFDPTRAGIPQEVVNLLKNSVISVMSLSTIQKKVFKQSKLVNGKWETFFSEPYIQRVQKTQTLTKNPALNYVVYLINAGYEYIGQKGNQYVFHRPEHVYSEEEMEQNNAAISNSPTSLPESLFIITDTQNGEVSIQDLNELQFLHEAVKLPSGEWMYKFVATKENAMKMRIAPLGVKILSRKQFDALPLVSPEEFETLCTQENTMTDIDMDNEVASVFVDIEQVGDSYQIVPYYNLLSNEAKDFTTYTAQQQPFWVRKGYWFEWSCYNEYVGQGDVDNVNQVGDRGNIQVFPQRNGTTPFNTISIVEGSPRLDKVRGTYFVDMSKDVILQGCIVMPGAGGKEWRAEVQLNVKTGEKKWL
jgi:hypothetical protein